MNDKDLISFKTWFSDYCRSFYSKDEEDNKNISLKECHTHNVCSNIKRILTDTPDLEDKFNTALMAETIALFHDVGRFPQYARYKTFRDLSSVDHGLLGTEVLMENKVLVNIPEKEQEIIIEAIRFHNAIEISGDRTAATLPFLKLVRDADKLDIWRIFLEYYDSNEETRASAVSLSLPDLPEYSREILSCLYKKLMISYSEATTLNDFKLIQLLWVYDLNFAASVKILKENSFIERLASKLPQTDDIKQAMIYLQDYVDERLAIDDQANGIRHNTHRPKVYFVGAGPGDPELLTLKGRRLLDSADVVIYAGSLVNAELLKGIKAEIYDSSKMALEEIIDLINNSVGNGKKVIRLHTGDPAFYSAISEQIERLRGLKIDYEVIPGVSSAMAGAAIIGQELTIPEISQTVIFTRLEGRTPVPELERLGELAGHRATMVIFLSVGMIEKVRDELLNGYTEDTPFVVVEKASWPEQRVIRGRLKDIAEAVKASGIRKTALIYIGDALSASDISLGKESRLYNKEFKHEYRK